MKAIVYDRYGSPEVLHLKEVEKPTPRDDEVLIRVQAASINSLDWRLMRANPFFIRFMVGGFLKPKNPILGVDVAGRVDAVGKDVRQFRPRDEVFGFGANTFAEYACAKENAIVLKPANISFEQAAAVPIAALTALQGLRDKGNIQAGQKVLINGASGGVGMFAIQIAKSFGAEVTGVCSTRNVDMAHSIGADHVIDYKREEFTRNGQRYDLILAANGYHPISDYLRALTPDGTYVVAGGSMLQLFQASLRARRDSKSGRQRIFIVSTARSQKDLAFMRELLEAGKVVPVIDGCYPLSKTAEAFRYFETVHAKGKVVITVEHECQ
ncbi:MAG TPA: NAD(P)-dependent alcohol dehydrogenase [Anaerolineales bacterium]|nr:NAD(P)-dependent alcohol dehydrogenase [Anaerolineales bacterium]